MANQKFNNKLPEKLLSIFVEAGFSCICPFVARKRRFKLYVLSCKFKNAKFENKAKEILPADERKWTQRKAKYIIIDKTCRLA